MYVAIEGIDRSGKSTQIQRLQAHFPEAIFTKEPGGTPLGQEIRRLLLHGPRLSPRSELFLFLADRNHHINHLIRPNRHRLIISDRSFISGIGYALAHGDLGLEELFKLNQIALEGIYPDLIVLLELSPQELARRFAQGEDRIETRGIDYLLQVQEHLKEALFKSGVDYIIIEATKSQEAITQEIVATIKGARWQSKPYGE
ncbi:MAG: dTMP kinase [Nitratiruptor sp.]|nr:dTMP kinase [Nitratiruptor sp.]NPA84106.1 dTMP kinase [Campylobacterota bacterium]